jgi:hypothetical protein
LDSKNRLSSNYKEKLINGETIWVEGIALTIQSRE